RTEARVVRRMRTNVRVDGGGESVQRVAPEGRDLRTGHLVAGTERRQLVRADRHVQCRVGRVRRYVHVVRERISRRDADVEAPGRVRERRGGNRRGGRRRRRRERRRRGRAGARARRRRAPRLVAQERLDDDVAPVVTGGRVARGEHVGDVVEWRAALDAEPCAAVVVGGRVYQRQVE